MIFRQRRLHREVRERYGQVLVQRLRLRWAVADCGRSLSRTLGTVGLLARGFGAGYLFDRVRPRWRGVYSASGLGMALLRIALVGEGVTRLVRDVLRLPR